jgi:DNA-binding CsgD family transcriptional regulator
MADTDDAFTLISDANTPEERAYAEYANTMKSLANQARTAMVNTGNIKYDSSASHTYQTEVDSLTSKLNIALMNAPREREAQRIASAKVAAKRLDNPDMTQSEIKKAGQQALTAARAQVGASRELIKISDREWEAIQAGAISENTLSKILNNTDIEDLRQRATPRTTTSLSNGQINRLTNLNASGYTIAQIARSLGVSSNVITNYLKGKE